MTDKQIIINEIDVSGCEYCLKMTKYRCSIQRDVYKCLYEENPNCHYKKLAHKTAKCENYKQALAEIEKIVSGTYYETEQTIRFKMQDIQDVIDKAKEI